MNAIQHDVLFPEGPHLFVGNPPPTNQLKKIPPNFWKLDFSPKAGIFLTEAPAFSLPRRLYGDTNQVCDRIFQTFRARQNNTGVLLAGEPGSGKSLLAKKLASTCVNAGIPCLIINNPYSGQALAEFFDKFDQELMVMIDEFEKVYDEDKSQNTLLPLLDGISQTKIMYVLTSNRGSINQYMLNRPGRIFYKKEYSGISADFAREYCEDTLVEKANIPGVMSVVANHNRFNFDMLQALVEEMNRYKETAAQSLKLLSIEKSPYRTFLKVVKAFKSGVEINPDRLFYSQYLSDHVNTKGFIKNYFMEDPSAKFEGNGAKIYNALYMSTPKPFLSNLAEDSDFSVISLLEEGMGGLLEDDLSFEEDDKDDKSSSGKSAEKKLVRKPAAILSSTDPADIEKVRKAKEAKRLREIFSGKPLEITVDTACYSGMAEDGVTMIFNDTKTGDCMHLQHVKSEVTYHSVQDRAY